MLIVTSPPYTFLFQLSLLLLVDRGLFLCVIGIEGGILVRGRGQEKEREGMIWNICLHFFIRKEYSDLVISITKMCYFTAKEHYYL